MIRRANNGEQDDSLSSSTCLNDSAIGSAYLYNGRRAALSLRVRVCTWWLRGGGALVGADDVLDVLEHARLVAAVLPTRQVR